MRRLWTSCVMACVIACAVPAAAPAFTSFSPPFTGGVDIATGFPACASATFGPTGVLFDGDKLFVTDLCGVIYRFGPAGGTAATAEATSAAPVANGAMTIAGGRYYATRFPFAGISSGTGVIEFDPDTLALTRTLTPSTRAARDHDRPAHRGPLLR